MRIVTRGIPALLAFFCLALAMQASAQTRHAPDASTLRVEVPPGKGQPLGASPLDLRRHGYVEQEVLVSGQARRYRATDPRADATPLAGSFPYTTRLIVRRPVDPKRFNGTVVVEWFNVTLGQDIDFGFAAMHEHLLRQGAVFVGVSAQRAGIAALKRAQPQRYGKLTAEAENLDAETGRILDDAGDVLAWDIYSQTAALLKTRPSALLGPLTPRTVLALGESQSALKLTHYHNTIHPLHRIYDGFLTYDRAGEMREDIGTPSISVGTEAFTFAPPADAAWLRWYEVAGSSHISLSDVRYLDPAVRRDGLLRSPQGQVQSLTDFVAAQRCEKQPTFSRIHPGQVLAAAFEHLQRWVTEGRPAPSAPRLQRGENGQLARDASGRVAGGVRLPAYDAPVADNSTDNGPAGVCAFAGHHRDFSTAELCTRYGSAEGYRHAQAQAAQQARLAGFLLKEDEAPDADALKRLEGASCKAG